MLTADTTTVVRKRERHFPFSSTLFVSFIFILLDAAAKSPNDHKLLLVWCLFMGAHGFCSLIEYTKYIEATHTTYLTNIKHLCRVQRCNLGDVDGLYSYLCCVFHAYACRQEKSKNVRAAVRTPAFSSIFPYLSQCTHILCVVQI